MSEGIETLLESLFPEEQFRYPMVISQRVSPDIVTNFVKSIVSALVGGFVSGAMVDLLSLGGNSDAVGGGYELAGGEVLGCIALSNEDVVQIDFTRKKEPHVVARRPASACYMKLYDGHFMISLWSSLIEGVLPKEYAQINDRNAGQLCDAINEAQMSNWLPAGAVRVDAQCATCAEPVLGYSHSELDPETAVPEGLHVVYFGIQCSECGHTSCYHKQKCTQDAFGIRVSQTRDGACCSMCQARHPKMRDVFRGQTR